LARFLEAFRELKQEGKIRAWGVSTSQIQQLQRFNAEGDCDVLQVDYSILNRTAEEDLFPYCLEHGIGVIVRGPIGMGLLAGKFDVDTTFPEDDFPVERDRPRWPVACPVRIAFCRQSPGSDHDYSRSAKRHPVRCQFPGC